MFLLSYQVNPAVTLSLLATRRLDVLRALVYIAAQCLGASLGAGALYLALPLKSTADHFVNRVSSQIMGNVTVTCSLGNITSFCNISVFLSSFSALLLPCSGSHRA